MNKRELSEQLQENLLTYLDGELTPFDEATSGVLTHVCDIVNNTIMNYETSK